MAAISFDPNVDYQAKINALKAINPNDPQISTLEQQRIAKGASDPLKYGKYFSDTTPIYSYMAQNAVEPAFNAEQLATEQRFDRLRQAQEAQKSTIDPVYDQYVDRTVEQYQKNKDMVNNETLNRGMGRSSYVVDKLTDVGNEEARAIGDINAQRVTAISNINANITTLDEQLAESLAQMDMNKASQIAARIDELRRYYDEISRDDARYADSKAMQEASLTGFYQGKPTLDREQFVASNALKQSAASGSGSGNGGNSGGGNNQPQEQGGIIETMLGFGNDIKATEYLYSLGYPSAQAANLLALYNAEKQNRQQGAGAATDTPQTSDVAVLAREMGASGATSGEILEMLNEAFRSGLITNQQYSKIRGDYLATRR